MRKMKKINGFLVVRFNDREKRNNPTLGSFGVIDAEQYTGDLDYDLDAFEYTDADLIEIAVEQARGLNAEEDFGEEPATYTVIAETATESREEEVSPKAMTLSWAEQLKTQIKSKHYPDIDPRTAAHELNGYKAALYDLGLLDRDDEVTGPDIFGAACALYTDDGHRVDIMPPSEEALAYVCDELCKFREGRTQEELDAICEKCKLESWARGQDKKATGPFGKRIAPEENVLGVLYKQHMCKQQEVEQGPESLETPYYPGKPGHSGYSAERLTKQS